MGDCSGLARRVHPRIAERLASGPPLALAQTKDLLNRGLERTLTEALEYESQAQAANLQGPDILEAFAAFSDKRDPDYTRAAAAR